MPSRRQPVSTVRSLAAPLTPSQMQHWDRLRAAIAQEQGLLIDYLDVEQRSTRRLIYPLGLFYWGGKWTVGSWCALRASFRDFRLDRIGALIRFAGAPARAAEVTLAAYLQHHSGPTRPTDNTLSVAPAHTTDSVHNRSN
jgi:predicted DNA-binding transcriptional regulator YafY